MPPNDRMLRAALRYAEHGWPVFPLRPRDKRPLTVHGFKNATTDPVQINRWWTEQPDANIGVPTGAVSGIVVLDVDGEAGEAPLRQLGGSVPTLTNLTGKGRHLLFQYPGEPIRSRTGFRDQLDVRGDGGYIVVPPSVHPDEHRYEWDYDHGMGWGLPLAPLPDRLLDVLTANGDPRTGTQAEHIPISSGRANGTTL